MNKIIPFVYPFDNIELLRIFNLVKHNLVIFHAPNFSTWLNVNKNCIKEFPYIKKIMSEFTTLLNLNIISSTFFWMQKKTIVHAHIDPNTLCSINHNISGGDGIIYYPGYNRYQYETALLDTKTPHGVIAGDKDRIQFKISIFDEDFNTVAAKLKLIDFDSVIC